MYLSKSQYIRGLQCHKSLWLQKYKPELKTKPILQDSLFEKGVEVGALAKQLFPNGVEVEFNISNFQGMIEKTKELMNSGCKTIYEASFSENGIFVMADILVNDGTYWSAYEVKSSTSVKDYHKDDAIIQRYVLEKSVNLDKSYIIHINNEYTRNKELDIKELFSIVDITDITKAKQDEIPKKLEDMKQMLKFSMPEIGIGGHCSHPNACDFQGFCWKDVPYPSIFNLYRINGAKKFEMFAQGIKEYKDIPENFKLNVTQKIQMQTYKTKEPFVDKNIIENFTAKVEYPINFFDFETFQNAIPRFDNQRPYMQIPFQYSLHILYEDGTLEHKEFLGDENSDSREDLIIQMLKDITPTGSIVAFNQSFEMSRIRELANFKEDKKEELLALNSRFVDLIVPFRARGYYHPDFHGSFSIKSVLPALFPNDDELDYKKLGSVQN